MAWFAWTKQARPLAHALIVFTPIPIADLVLAWSHGAGAFAFVHAPAVLVMPWLASALLAEARRDA